MLVVKLLDTLPISRDIMIQFDGEWVAFVGLTNVYRILRVSAFFFSKVIITLYGVFSPLAQIN
ncbi:hypothetical protein K439DRAFT_1635844 [Ramaria rubella]|nr:hypothetical protein K439DRAFT_1635844 [Ramaria rubella]